MRAAWGQDEERKARKQHQCDWCLGPILQGEMYLRWYGETTDGDVTAYVMHHECRLAIDREYAGASYTEDVSWTSFHRRGMTLEETEQMDAVL